MASKKQILSLGALVLGALIFMAWLAGLLTFGKIAPGVVSLPAGAPAGRVLVIKETPIPRKLEVLGEVISPSLFAASSQVPGKVIKLWVEAGSKVKPGEPLVTLSGEEYQARVNQARAAVAQAQAQLAQATSNYKRFQYLRQQGAASPQEFEAIEARFKAAQAGLAAAQAQVKEAATLSGYTVVRAPESAVVAARKVAVGDVAQPGQPLMSLYNPDLLQIEGEVNDSYRGRVQVGGPVAVSVPAINWHNEAAIAEIFPISQGESRTFKVRTAMIKNPELVPGMFARLELPLASTLGILIPRDAVHQVGQLTMVKVAVSGRAEWRQVKLGRQVETQVEVLAGLQPGDRIMLPKN